MSKIKKKGFGQKENKKLKKEKVTYKINYLESNFSE